MIRSVRTLLYFFLAFFTLALPLPTAHSLSVDNVIDANVILAEELLQRRNYTYAHRLLKNNENEEPNVAVHNERLGLLNMRWARHIEITGTDVLSCPYYEEALVEFEKGLHKSDNTVAEDGFKLLKSEALIHLGLYEEARTILADIQQRDGDAGYADYLFGLSLFYQMHRADKTLTPAGALIDPRIHEVDRYFARAVRKESDALMPFAHIVVGLLDYRNGAWDLAIGELQRGIDSMQRLAEANRVGAPDFTPIEKMYLDEATAATDNITARSR